MFSHRYSASLEMLRKKPMIIADASTNVKQAEKTASLRRAKLRGRNTYARKDELSMLKHSAVLGAIGM